MRLIGTIQGEKKALSFFAFLKQEEIEVRCDPALKQEEEFEIWIANEEQVEIASHWLQEFQEDPSDPRFETKPHPFDQAKISAHPPRELKQQDEPFPIRAFRLRNQKAPQMPITRLLILLSFLLFIWNFSQRDQLEEKKVSIEHRMTPLEKALSFEAQAERDPTSSQSKKWKGLYFILLNWPQAKIELEPPPFTSFQKGEIYRLFTPALLNKGFLPLLINIFLLAMLGRQVEERVKKWQYLMLTLFLGILTNTLQFLVSGALITGYSSILCGLGGFIWSRQRIAPWEGYPLKKGMVQFFGLLILGFTFLQTLSFIGIFFQLWELQFHFENAGHLFGVFLGILLGRASFLSEGRQ